MKLKLTFLIFTLAIGTIQAQIDLKNGLVAYFPFNGNANDESGNSNKGMVNGATLTTDRFGNAISAYDFDGTDDFIGIGNPISLNNFTSLTLSAWVYLRRTDLNQGIICKTNGGDNDFGFEYNHYNGDNLSMTTNFNYSPQGVLLETGPLQAFNWVHLIGIWNGSTVSVYKNGVLIATAPYTGKNLIDGNQFLAFGKLGSHEAGWYFDGKIDEVCIYNRALNKAEVDLLFKPTNHKPIANSGPDRLANEGTHVALNGTASSDPDIDMITYRWTAPAGIVLSSDIIARPSFIAPEVIADTSYLFTLVVNDRAMDSEPDSVSVLILNSGLCLRNDSLALVTFYYSTGGTNWTRNDNWLTGPVNTWYGVTVNECNVTEIQLLANNLKGTLPPEIGNLKQLKRLSLADNLLTGNIPVEIGQLTNITYLRFWNNQLSGNIPSEIGQLTNLITLDLGPNKLSGNIPPEIGQLINLKDLIMQNNELTGPVPKEIWQLTNLTSLYLGQNQLSGNIPKEIGQLANLTYLDFGGNQLNDNIPAEIGQLTKLTYLNFAGNQLTGNIPAEIGHLTKLLYFRLWDNKLSGEIPSEIGQLKELSYLDLGINQFSGSLPSEIWQIKSLEGIVLSNNQLTGEIPLEIGQLAKLKNAYLDNNKFDEIPNLSNIGHTIWCYNNLLTFEDFERNLDQIGKEGLSFVYSPQQMFGREYDTITIEGFPVKLNIPCRGKYNHYQWFKDGIQILSAPDASKLAFPTVHLSDSGFYHVLVTNDSVPNLWLQSKSVKLSVKLNLQPFAIAGSDQSVNEGVTVILDGSKSSDPDGNPLTYKWTAPAGINLSSTSAAKPTFTAPDVTDITNYIIKLVVNDGYLYSQDDTVIITVKPVYIINESKSICNGQSYIGWTTSGTYKRTLQTKAGCDSIVTTVLTLNPTYSINESKSICNGQSYNGWTTSGTYKRTLQTKAGCDSVVTTVLTVNPTYSINESKSICNGQSYNGWTTSGTYKRTLQTIAGCDSVVTTVLTVNPTYSINESKSICNGQSYNGWTTSGTYKRTLQSKAGCDSIITTVLIVNPVYNITENKSICSGQSYNGWTTSGTFQRKLKTKFGCDSIITTNLTVTPIINTTENKSICKGQNYLGWTSSGTYKRTLQSKAGCDSIVTTILTVNPVYNITENKSICSGQSYNGWTTTGTFQRKLTTKSGCDSIISTNLTVISILNTTENKSICKGQNYLGWTSTGTYKRTLQSKAGCDSIVTTILTVNPVYNITENKSICSGQSYNGWTNSGTFQRKLSSKSGCDSIITTNLTVIPIINITENKSICQGQNYLGWSSSGTYKRTLQSKAGCDSIVTTILTVNPVYNIVENKSICSGQSYIGWTTSGTYKRTLQSKAGCDSIVTTNLTVNTAFQPAISHQRDTLKSTDAYQSYQWFDDKGKISGATSKQYVIGKSGKYHLEISDNNGCTQTSAELSLIYTNAIILNLPEFKYSVIPNPNTGKFTFRVDSKPQGKINLHLVNPLGQTVEKRELRYDDTNYVEQFDISHLSKGMYHLIIRSDNGQKSEKIMVQ